MSKSICNACVGDTVFIKRLFECPSLVQEYGDAKYKVGNQTFRYFGRVLEVKNDILHLDTGETVRKNNVCFIEKKGSGHNISDELKTKFICGNW